MNDGFTPGEANTTDTAGDLFGDVAQPATQAYRVLARKYRPSTFADLIGQGAMVLHIAERAGKLIPADPAARIRAIQWLTCALNSVEPW